MKWLLLPIILILKMNLLISQVTSEDINPLYKAINQENYQEANQISKELLIKFKNENYPMLGLIRYINLFSNAVLVSEDKISYKELKELTRKYEGKLFVMAAHPTTTDLTQEAYKYNILKKENGKITSTTKASNKENTIIYIYEYFEYTQDFNIDEFNGRDTRCRGVLKKVEINKVESKDWIMKIYFEDAKIHKINEE